MANTQIGTRTGVTAAGIGGANNPSNLNGSVGTAAGTAAWDTDHTSIDTMRTRLAAIDGTFYTSARLDTLSMNDMEYAIRVNDLATTIKQ